MSKSILIRSGKIYEKRWDSEVRQYVETEKPEQLLSDVLQCPVEITDTTFEQFFQFVIAEQELFERIFKGALYGWSLDSYIEEIRKPAHPESEEGLDYVEVYWHASPVSKEAGSDIDIEPSFHGWGDWNQSVPGTPEKGGLAIEWTPVHHYKRKPLRLDPRCSIYDVDQKRIVLDGNRTYAVYDVLSAILFEITWGGDTSTRDENRKEIFDRANKTIDELREQSEKEGEDDEDDEDEEGEEQKPQ